MIPEANLSSVQSDHEDMVYSQPVNVERNRYLRSNNTRSSYHSIPTDTSLSQSQEWNTQGHMSPARRTFCLFALFDLILTFILWIIYTQLIGKTPISKGFEDQIYQYTFPSSLFDTVMISTARFTFIMLAYALFRISHWWVIAISTSMTCIYLLFKSFLFEFNDAVLGGKNPLSYILLIVCFLLAWIETWMLDFKVVPTEKRIRRRGHHSSDLEREPLLSNRHSDTSSAEDTREFYSPLNTPEGSEDETDHHNSYHRHHRHVEGSVTSAHSRKDTEHYLQLLADAKTAFLEILDLDGWKYETGKTLQEGIIHSQNSKKYGRKLFKLQGIVDMDPHDLWNDMMTTLNDSPKWNPTILESRTLQVIDENSEITYSISAEAAGGLVSARDFINLRQMLRLESNMFISYGVGCVHADMPVQKKYVRGDNGPGGWAFQAAPDDPDKCLFTWIVNTNLKGWLPQAAIDQAMSGVLVSYFKMLVEHYREVCLERSNTL